MVTIEITFLTGRYHATPWMRHVNEGAAEWPPSPWRFFRTLTALWLRYGNKEERAIFISLLDKLAEDGPDFKLPQANQSFTQHYMPQGKENTKLVFDNFITMEKGAKCYLIWKQVELSFEESALLRDLLSKLNYFGRAEGWIEAKLINYLVEPNVIRSKVKFIDNAEYKRVLIPKRTDDLYENLLSETSELRKKGYLEPLGSTWETYSLPQDLYRVNPRQYSVKTSINYDVVRYALVQKPKPSVTETLLIADLARKAALSQYGRLTGGEKSKTLSGKESDGVVLKGHVHAYYLPTDEDRDGFIDHLTVYAPKGFTRQELIALSRIEVLKTPYANWEFALTLIGCWNHEELSQHIPIFKKSNVWISATPFLLGRYPKFKRNGQPRLDQNKRQIDGAYDQLLKELRLRQDVCNLAEVIDISEPKYISTRPAKHKYRFIRIGKSQVGPGVLYNFKIEFAQAISGPLSVGANCHFGLGSFVPDGDL